MIAFKLPPELIQLTLSFLSPSEIDDLFEINEIFHDCQDRDDPYFQIRLIALQEYFSNRRLMLSNSYYLLDYVEITLEQIKYLKRENIMVNPREISVFISDRLVTTDEVEFIKQLCYDDLLQFVTSWSTKKLKFQLELINTVGKEALSEVLMLVSSINCKLETFLLKYNGKLPYVECDFSIDVNNLKLQLPGSPELLQDINRNDCFTNITSLNLSFNGISDYSLGQFKFPQSLVQLNLSNNLLTNVDDFNFNWKCLTKLESLDLSNNNIQHFNLHGRSENLYQLTQLKLSGNHLVTVPKLYNAFFGNLRELDLSRNMLCCLHRFPGCLLKLSLRGNYLTQFHTQVQGDIFPKTLTHLDLSHCRIGCQHELTTEEISNHLVSVEKLYNLSDLQIEG
ncbi:uncharacterized protein SPAPADRAFT_50493 [Spathaspora passalidarum NRRL Y-27907]|uniref:F-box domain-containing protein n=1 Tax=Spathaspora passalidarum (strain NRRL Y-27907 / 11-Y1) TaxID=619300 RepID=G3AKN3_SPAPN|nr:uncharacterized protein SPAPADRAFT_50493 [Spathaspora passalidarum NRRL Y-27907]EGW33638.1 hypothetical protein SPAPADRAFT_50493 [Spathaspora passalidarum NRRL Y-27907]